MAQRSQGRGETIPDQAGLLDAMGDLRHRLIATTRSIRPQGPAYHALSMVTAAIDALAHFMTGQPYYFAVGGSVRPLAPIERDQRRADDADEP